LGKYVDEGAEPIGSVKILLASKYSIRPELNIVASIRRIIDESISAVY
jgi:hypothetical protein